MYTPDVTRWNDRTSLFKPALNADQTELEAIKYGSSPIDTGVQDDVIADEHHADDLIADSNWEQEDFAVEEVTGKVTSEIDRRILLGNGSYPFTRRGNTLKYTPSSTSAYEFCLITSLQKNITKAPFNSLPITFELLSAEIAKHYLGEPAECIRTGWPSHGADRPKSFIELIKLVSQRTGEFNWQPKIPVQPGEVDLGPKDEGMDYVAWKPFGDQRTGKVFLLGQCACGNDWESKLKDLNKEKLEQWVNPITWAQFLPAFSVPHHIPGHYIFSYVCEQAGITFDRLRLAIISEKCKDELSQDLQNKLKDGIRLVLPAYKI